MTPRHLPLLAALWGAAWAGLVAGAAQAQFSQYSPPEEFGEDPVPMAQRLDDAIRQARWKLGRLFLDPDLGIRNVAWVGDLGLGDESTSRSGLTGAIGGGVRTYLPVGDQLTWAAYALPEYIWWENSRERSRLGGRAGLGLFGSLGRLGVEASLSGSQEVRFVSRELEERANRRGQQAALAIELPVKGTFFLSASGNARRQRYRDEPVLEGLDRDERWIRAGVRYRFRRGLVLGVGYQTVDVDFDRTPRRSNSGDGPVFEAEYDLPRLRLGVDLFRPSLEPDNDPAAAGFEAVTGRVRIAYLPQTRLALELFGNRNVVWAVTPDADFFDDSSWGAGLRVSLGTAASVRLFGETGSNEYATFVAGPTGRVDDLEALGGDLRVKLGRVSLTLGVTRTEYDSNLPQFDRSVTRYRSGLQLGLVERLSPWG